MPFFKRDGRNLSPPHGRTIPFESEEAAAFTACLLNSSLFYWFYSTFSDCEHINDVLLRSFRIPAGWNRADWGELWGELSKSLQQTSRRKVISTKQGHRIEYDEIEALNSKPLIDSVDNVLARLYGFTDEELDFIINYDVKYRMGRDADIAAEHIND